MVYKYHTAVDAVCKAPPAVQVRRVNGTAESEGRGISQGHGLVFVFDDVERRDRAERLQEVERVMPVDVGDDGWFHEESRPINTVAAQHHPCAAGFGGSNLVEKSQ